MVIIIIIIIIMTTRMTKTTELTKGCILTFVPTWTHCIFHLSAASNTCFVVISVNIELGPTSQSRFILSSMGRQQSQLIDNLELSMLLNSQHSFELGNVSSSQSCDCHHSSFVFICHLNRVMYWLFGSSK